jgi:hypothetical protein
LFDQSRDFYLRLNFKDWKISLRHTQRGQWGVLYDITGIFN